jgi:hypothetical protein
MEKVPSEEELIFTDEAAAARMGREEAVGALQ